jgi:exoribonuclease R
MGNRIVVSFDQWPSTSEYPLGHFKRIIGAIGDIKAEGDVILLEHNV